MSIKVSFGEKSVKCEWIAYFKLSINDSTDPNCSIELYSKQVSKAYFLEKFAKIDGTPSEELLFILKHITDLEMINVHVITENEVEVWLTYRSMDSNCVYFTVPKQSKVIHFLGEL